MTTRPFNDAQNDFEKMWQFVRQDYAWRGENFIWLFSRLGDWKYGLWNDKKASSTFFRDHAQLWFDEAGRLLGFVLSEDGDNIFFILTAQGYEALYAEILDWTVDHWGPRYASLKTEVHEFQAEALTVLTERGFRSLGEIAVTRQYDLQTKAGEDVRLPEGFRIVSMAENGHYYRKALLNKNGFGGEDLVSELELERFAHSRLSPAYEAQYDLSVVTPEGVHVASCVGFNDPDYGVAEVEKVCTHSRYRRQGLGEAVIRECFKRLQARGIEKAYITGYSGEANGLYEKLGPCWRKRWFHYEWSTPR